MNTLSHSDLLQLKRWNTLTIYNGWERITKRNPAAEAFNLEETRDFMPQMGPTVGYAVTVVVEPSNKAHRPRRPGRVERLPSVCLECSRPENRMRAGPR